LIFREQ